MKKYLSIILILSMSLCLICCGKNGGETESNTSERQTESESVSESSSKEDNEILLSGFDSFRECLTMAFENSVTRIDMATSEQYKTQGDACAKLTCVGTKDAQYGYYSDCWFYIIPGNEYLEKVDYSDVVSYSLDVYNGMNRDIEINFGVGHIMFVSDCYLFGYRTLKPGKNHLTFNVDRTTFARFTDIHEIKCFYITIEGRRVGESEIVLYFDNFTATTTDEPFIEPTNDISNGVLFDFSKTSDFYAFTEYGSASSRFTIPRYSVNSDVNYVLTGRKSLKIDFFANRIGTKTDVIGFRCKDGLAGDWNKFDFSKKKLTFDLYNDTDYDISVGITVYSNANESISRAYFANAHSWLDKTRVDLTLKDIDDAFLGTGLDIMCIAFDINGLPAEQCTLYLDNISIVDID